VDPKVLGLDVLIDRSEPGGSWFTSSTSQMAESGGDDTF